MCLKQVTKQHRKPTQQVDIVYKIFNRKSRSVLGGPYMGGRMKTDEWYTASRVSLCSLRDGVKYPSGFHCFDSFKDALVRAKRLSGIGNVIVKCAARGKICEGLEYDGTCRSVFPDENVSVYREIMPLRTVAKRDKYKREMEVMQGYRSSKTKL
jgi:hypothetical protein